MTIIGELLSPQRLVRIGPAVSTAEAARRSADEGVSHLLVTEGERLLGVVCVCDLDAAEVCATVSECMSTNLVSVGVETGVEQAIALMQARGVSCLPVLSAGKLRGLVTLHELRRAGFVEPALERCSACGSTEHVRCSRHAECIGLCLSCARKSEPPRDDGDDDELGGGGQ